MGRRQSLRGSGSIWVGEVAAAVIDGGGAVGIGEFDAESVFDEVENHLAHGFGVRLDGGIGCFWLVLLGCFEFAMVQIGFHALASGLGGKLISGGANHLDEFG